MNKINVVIVTYSWPPRNSISTHRPYSWAKYWSKNGAKVTVLTAKKQSYDEPLDMPLPKIDGVEVIEVSYQDLITWLPNKLLKIPGILAFSKRVKASMIGLIGGTWDPREAWLSAALEVAKELALKNDIVVSTFGPSVAHFIACEMKKKNPSIRWIADYRDLWNENPNLVQAPIRYKKKLRNIEMNTVGKYADLLTAVSEDMVKKLIKLTGKTTIKMPNGFDVNEEDVRKIFLKTQTQLDGTFRIVYTGLIYKKHRDPTPLLEALAELLNEKKISKNSVTVDFYSSKIDFIKDLYDNPKFKPFIRIMGHVSRKKALEAQRNAGLLLLLETSQPEGRGVITGKIFEYIASGKPIICVGSHPEFEIGKILSTTGTGKVFLKNQLKEIKEIIIQSMLGKGLYESYKPNFDEVVKFSRARIASQYYELIKKLVSEKIVKIKSKFDKISLDKIPSTTITHIITGLERGGAERSLYNLLTNGLEGPFKNRVISLMSEGYYGPLLKKKGIPLVSLNMSRGIINPKALWKLHSEIKKNPPDIIQGWMHPGNLAAFYASIITSKKIRLAWNVRLSLEIYKEMKIKTRATIRIGALLSKSPKVIIYNSFRSRNQHRKFGFIDKNDKLISNGFLLNRWAPNEEKRKIIRNQLSIKEEIKVIGYVGRGDAQKDLPNLFDAFDEVSKKNPNTILVAIGRNLDKYNFKSNKIKFLGECSNINELMLSFDVFCLSSRAEGFPNVIGEAMACGVPCVTTDVGDSKYIVDKTGWVVPPRNSKILAENLNLALSFSNEELKIKGKLARKRVLDNFSMETVKEKYISVYQSILK